MSIYVNIYIGKNEAVQWFGWKEPSLKAPSERCVDMLYVWLGRGVTNVMSQLTIEVFDMPFLPPTPESPAAKVARGDQDLLIESVVMGPMTWVSMTWVMTWHGPWVMGHGAHDMGWDFFETTFTLLPGNFKQWSDNKTCNENAFRSR